MSTTTPRLLVVDDEPFNLDIISEFLAGTGHELSLAQCRTIGEYLRSCGNRNR